MNLLLLIPASPRDMPRVGQGAYLVPAQKPWRGSNGFVGKWEIPQLNGILLKEILIEYVTYSHIE